MNKRLIPLAGKVSGIAIAFLLLLATQVQATVLSATGSTSTPVLSASTDNRITVTWNVVSTSDRQSTVAEVPGIRPTTLAGNILPTSQITRETFTITALQVQGWLDDGLSSIVIRRNFASVAGDPAGGINAEVQIRLASSGLRASRELALFEIQRMRLGFDNQTNLIVVESGASLNATLEVNYSGSGVLEGSWQIAEPGSTEGLPLYRTLKLEKRTLSAAQRSSIASPLLPTAQAGKYLLRFCLLQRDETLSGGNDFNCPDERRVVEAAYQVLAEARPPIENIGLTAARELGPDSLLAWSEVAGTVVYQLQVYQPLGQQQPVFVTGMLLPHMPAQASLSTLVMDKLEAGKSYLWRINALDSQGQLIGQSEFANFTYSQQ